MKLTKFLFKCLNKELETRYYTCDSMFETRGKEIKENQDKFRNFLKELSMTDEEQTFIIYRIYTDFHELIESSKHIDPRVFKAILKFLKIMYGYEEENTGSLHL